MNPYKTQWLTGVIPIKSKRNRRYYAARGGSEDWSSYWTTLISATVEDAAPTNVVLTFPTAKTLVATDLTCTVNGVARAISSASWLGGVWTVVLAYPVVYGDVVVMTFVKTSQTANVTNNVTIDTELNTYVTGLTTPLSNAQLTDLGRFIYDTKAILSIATLAEFFDLLYVGSEETSESSLKNLARDAYHMEVTGTPTFTQFEGYESIGDNHYLKTGYIPNTHKINALQDDTCEGCYIPEVITNNINSKPYGTLDTAVGPASSINTSYGNKTYANQNDGSSGYINNKGLFPGYYVTNRTAAENFQLNINFWRSTITTASTGLSTKQIYVCCFNDRGNDNAWFLHPVSLYWRSKGMTAAQLYGFFRAFEKYMIAKGKGVIGESIGVIGDSISDLNAAIYAWPSNFVSGVHAVADYAVSGHAIVVDLAADVANLVGDGYDKIIIHMGTNDNDAGDMGALQAAVESAIDTIKTNCPSATIYYMNVLPRWNNVDGDIEVDKSHIRIAIAAACAVKGISCWDTYTDPWIVVADTSDGTHPSAAGAIKIYNEVLSRI